MKNQFKVTECWADNNLINDGPDWFEVSGLPEHNYRPAILMWKEGYDRQQQRIRELESKLNYFIDVLKTELGINRAIYFAEAYDDRK